MAAWIGAEFAVAFGLGVAYGICNLLLSWSEEILSGFRLVSYILSLLAALMAVTMAQRILTAKSTPDHWSTPPLPPQFDRAA
jgi:hypothetical protein